MVNAPLGYVVPHFPALFWPLGSSRESFNASFLYHTSDIWKFTLYWAMIFTASVHMIAGLWMMATHYKHTQRAVIVVIFTCFIIWGVLIGFVAGSVVGVLLAAVYNAAQFRMTPWVPFVWGLLIMLYNILASYNFYVTLI